jgi:hypothetical protein
MEPAADRPGDLNADDAGVTDDRVELDILRALERGDIDVAEASRRLAELADGPRPEPDHAG